LEDAEETAAACFPAVVPLLLQLLAPSASLAAAAALLHRCDPASADSSSGSQAKASAALLAVVLARGLVQLADAMEAAGPQLLFASLMTKQCSEGAVRHVRRG
jgi:hypothetical protein